MAPWSLTKQAIDRVKKFQNQLANIGRPDAELKAVQRDGGVLLEQLKVLKAEGMLSCALTQAKTEAAPKSTIRWSQDVVRKQLMAIVSCESLVQPCLLQACKVLIAG